MAFPGLGIVLRTFWFQHLGVVYCNYPRDSTSLDASRNKILLRDLRVRMSTPLVESTCFHPSAIPKKKAIDASNPFLA